MMGDGPDPLVSANIVDSIDNRLQIKYKDVAELSDSLLLAETPLRLHDEKLPYTIVKSLPNEYDNAYLAEE